MCALIEKHKNGMRIAKYVATPHAHGKYRCKRSYYLEWALDSVGGTFVVHTLP